MRYLSSRGRAPEVSFSEAVATGLAPDGGLYLPVQLPTVDPSTFPAVPGLPQVAAGALAGFVAGDRLESSLGDIARAALDFPAPTTAVEGAADPLFALELFHGPTAAFKDFGARFLAECLERIEAPAAGAAPKPPMTILVATSGDTGGAVAAAFHRRPWVRVVILYPKGLVSPRQERQLTCWGGNVASLRIDGTFDDCQRLVKEAFNDPGLRAGHRLSSANSINVGRLLPQTVYYAASSVEVRKRTGSEPSYVIPAGNLGNAFAAMWARAMGFPIGRIVLAHNRNRTVPDFFRTGAWEPRPSVATPASAMDVGNPSNMERVRALYPSIAQIREHLSADSVDDATIRARIGEDFMRYGREWCPHTATAAEVYARLDASERRARPWVIVATAHPAKFNEIVEPIIGKPVIVPESLARLLSLPQQFKDLPPTLGALAAALE
ncbi:MAG TPA: threonine synthase [Steroidobacteraceae bacterium]|jgi:threonine synthase|nr:threonine synthase [Steroidobacteraceae bacterium]